ncbi:MAG: LPO_1073/Vpar_1526 family protein [Cyanobacteria bacterium P01_F01_bin.53]
MRDDFSKPTKRLLAERANFICTNPSCRRNQLAPSSEQKDKVIHLGKAAHICAASSNGPRYDASQSSEERASIDNAIYLCGSCADKVDKNNGADFSVQLLLDWKQTHEEWVASKLNRGELDEVVTHNIIWQEFDAVETAINNSGTVIVNQGITEQRAKEIASELFEANFTKLSKEASDTALSRANLLTERLLTNLEKTNSTLERFSDPAVQSTLYDAQKTYALSGHSEKLEALCDMLTARVSGAGYDLVDLTLDKAIQVCRELTPAMINTLSFVMAVRYRIVENNTIPKFIDANIKPLVGNLALSNPELRHLEQAGCLVVSRGMISKQSIGECYAKLYPEVAKQLKTQSTKSFDEHLIKWHPFLAEVIERWEDSILSHSTLQPAGVCIAWANLSTDNKQIFDYLRWLHAR